MKYKLVAFWLIVFGALFAFLQMCFEYHFYYIEQSQLFLFSEAYIRNKLLLPGGFSMLVAEFLVQFFIRPYVGALVTEVLLTGVGVCTAGIVKRIAPVSGLFILYVLPMLALLFMHFDFNYRVQGTVCYLMMMALLCGYMRIRNDLFRLVAGCVLVPVLFWLAGSITVLFAGMVCLFEGLRICITIIRSIQKKSFIILGFACLWSFLSLSLSGIRIVCPGRNCLRGSVVLLNWL